jgi:hypothetical protein
VDKTFPEKIIDETGKEVYLGLAKHSRVDYNKMYKEGRLPPLTDEKIICELQLLGMGNIFPLDIWIDQSQFMSEISNYKNEWVDYLPKKDRPNNRKGLCLFGMPGDSHKDSLSMPEARARHKKELFEEDFNQPTDLYKDLPSLHNFLDYFQPLGRTFLLKANEGGWFPPHRDAKWIGRDTFRLVAFLNNCTKQKYNWVLEDKVIDIEMGRVYYINTRLPHHTFTMDNDSIKLIVNVKMCLENVLKVLTYG